MSFGHVLLLEQSPGDRLHPYHFFIQIKRWNLTVTHASRVRNVVQERAVIQVYGVFVIVLW